MHEINEYVIKCPCCDKTIKIRVSRDGNISTFLLEESPITVQELSKMGIELGVIEEVNRS